MSLGIISMRKHCYDIPIPILISFAYVCPAAELQALKSFKSFTL